MASSLAALTSLASQWNVNIYDKEFAKILDENDSLSSFKKKFTFPKRCLTSGLYFAGNSLGLCPVTTKATVNAEIDHWENYGVEGHFEGKLPWVTVDETCIEQMAEIVGAKVPEVALMNSLTVNLHLMMIPFYRPTTGRYKILIEGKAFPSDMYAVQSQAKLHGYSPEDAILQLVPREGETFIRTKDINETLQREGDTIALVLLSGIQYYTGEFFDIPSIVKVAHEKGCRVGVDLAHAVGNVELKLHEWAPDFAVWCTYKYLNSGPGSIGGCFIHEKHHDNTDLHRLAGWWGHRKSDRFEMDPEFIPSTGAFGFQLSNPPVLCIAALRASLELFKDATMPKLRSKSVLLTGLLEVLLNKNLSDSVKILTPADPDRRGAQLSLVFTTALNLDVIHDKLTTAGVICDLRKPNVMRIAPCPLYNSFTDVYSFVTVLSQALKE